MKTTIKLVATIVSLSLVTTNVAFAKNGGNGGNGGNHSSGGGNKSFSAFKFSSGGGSGQSSSSQKSFQTFGSNQGQKSKPLTISNLNNNNNNNHSGLKTAIIAGTIAGLNNNNNNCHNNNNNCYDNNHRCYGYNNYPSYGAITSINDQNNFGQAFEPFHSNYVVLPGDTFFEVSLKEYGTSANAAKIAQFNNLPQSAALRPGQILQLPSISVNGQLSRSNSPVADSLRNTTTSNNVVTNSPVNNNFVATTNNGVAAPAPDAPRPKVTIGSTLMVDGQAFGDKPGVAKLRVSGISLPVEVVEWKSSAVKIHLPNVDLTSATNADIEVTRADGSLASKTPVELGTPTEVALTK